MVTSMSTEAYGPNYPAALADAENLALHHQFEDLEQQRDASELGMWIFLATELLFFGGLFTCYIVYREIHFDAFRIGSRLLEANFGAIMTAVLLGSSFTMAMAVRSAQINQR